MLDLLIVQLTPFCNINCSYCYLNDRSNPRKISQETIHFIIDRLLEDRIVPDRFTIVFHSGEPLVVSPEFLRSVISPFSSRLNTDISYSIQTNGTLISQEWCDLIKEYGIHIGVSIDGPQFINDANRKTRNGKGTYGQVMAGIALLQKNAIPYHGIAVITRDSLAFPKEIFDFFHDNGFTHLGLNIEESEGVHSSSSVFAKELEDSVVKFYQEIYSHYLHSDRRLKIREFDRALSSILRTPGLPDIRLLPVRSHQLEPFAIITVDYNGNFSTFSPELTGQKNKQYGDFILGNVREMGFRKAARSPLFKAMRKDIAAGVKNCRKDCGYFNVCGGGAPANKLYENNSFASTETSYCRYNIQVPLNLVLGNLESNLNTQKT